MKSILEFLADYEEFEILRFDEDMIFNKPIEVSPDKTDTNVTGVAQVRGVHRLLFEQIPPGEGYPICQKV